VSGAQRHDVGLLAPTLDQVVVPRPPPEAERQHLCGDKGYTGQPADQAVRARRWVVERTHSWLNGFRNLLVRFKKTAAGYEGLPELACASITYRQVVTI
jgi:putative transposase